MLCYSPGIGYCDWKNAACRIEKHENSQSHRVATLAKPLKKRASTSTTVGGNHMTMRAI